MLADFEAELVAIRIDPRRSGLLRAVFSLLEAERLDGCQLGGLVADPIVVPPSTGIAAAGQSIAEIAALLDGGTLFVGVATSARTALSLHTAHVEWASGVLDLEHEHGRDAIIRLVGLGLVAEGLCEGDCDAAAAGFVATESGRAALIWFSVVEIILGFGTTDECVEADKILALLDTFFEEAILAWSEFSSERALARARIIVNNWTDLLCPVVTAAAALADPIAELFTEVLGDEPPADIDALRAEAAQMSIYCSLVARHLGEQAHGLPAVFTPTNIESDSHPALKSAEQVATASQSGHELAMADQAKPSVALKSAAQTRGKSLKAQHRAAHAAKAAYEGRLTLLSSMALSGVDVLQARTDVLNHKKTALKKALLHSRNQRRSAAAVHESASAAHEAMIGQIAGSQAEIVTASAEIKACREALKASVKAWSADAAKQTKRRRRYEEMEDRQAGADAVVATLSEDIGLTRHALTAVVAALSAAKAAQQRVVGARVDAIVSRLEEVRVSHGVDQARLEPLLAAAGMLAEKLEDKNTAASEVASLVADGRRRHRAAAGALVSDEKGRVASDLLNTAAFDMLRNNARRLEDAHSVLKKAQDRVDALAKERNMAMDRHEREKLELTDLEAFQEQTSQDIAVLSLAIERTKADEPLLKARIVQAQNAQRQARKARQKSIAGQIQSKAAQISAWRDDIGEAIDDRKGLAIAEVRVDSERLALVSRHDTVRDGLAVAITRRKTMVLTLKDRGAQAGVVQTRLGQQFGKVQGARLTLQAAKATRDRCATSVLTHASRLSVLAVQLSAAREAQEEGAECVADFQSWVDRTKGPWLAVN